MYSSQQVENFLTPSTKVLVRAAPKSRGSDIYPNSRRKIRGAWIKICIWWADEKEIFFKNYYKYFLPVLLRNQFYLIKHVLW